MTSTTTPLLIGGLGGTELLIILAVLLLLFGASTSSPSARRGSGQALRIFKSETKGLMDDDGKDTKAEPKHVAAPVLSGRRPDHRRDSPRPGRLARLRGPAMSIASVTDMLRVAPSHPGSTGGPDVGGRPSLRELRARLIRSALVLVVAFGVSLLFFDPLLALVLGPYNQARDLVGADTTTSAYVAGATGSLHAPPQALRRRRPHGRQPLLAVAGLGVRRPRAAGARESGGRASSRWSPAPGSSGAWRWVTTCSPRA